jgi:hypothetical protein
MSMQSFKHTKSLIWGRYLEEVGEIRIKGNDCYESATVRVADLLPRKGGVAYISISMTRAHRAKLQLFKHFLA